MDLGGFNLTTTMDLEDFYSTMTIYRRCRENHRNTFSTFKLHVLLCEKKSSEISTTVFQMEKRYF